MNDESSEIIRLQPRQLYDIIIAYQRGYDCSITEMYEFWSYSDEESLKCAINDYNQITHNTKGTIEITLEPLKSKTNCEKHVPYLHDICDNNIYFSNILGLNTIQGNITLSAILRNPNELFQRHSSIVCEAIANNEIMYDKLGVTTQIYDTIQLNKDSTEHISQNKN